MIDSVQPPSKHIGSYFGSIFNRSQFRWARIFLGYTVLTQCFTTFFNRKPRANAAYCHVFSPIPTSPRFPHVQVVDMQPTEVICAIKADWMGFLGILDENSPASKKNNKSDYKVGPKKQL